MKVCIKKTELLAILNENKKKHREIYEKAYEEYRKQSIKELEVMLDEAKAGRNIRRSVNLIEPTDQTKDYHRAIRMMQLETREAIELEEAEFQRYVMDDWVWKQQWANSITPYFGGLNATWESEGA